MTFCIIMIMAGCGRNSEQKGMEKIELLNPDRQECIPQYYSSLRLEGAAVDIYVFINSDGECQYRAYGKREYEKETVYDFVPVVLDLNIGGFTFFSVKDADFVDINAEDFGQVIPEDADAVPEIYSKVGRTGHYIFINKDVEREFRVYGGFPGQELRFWTSDENGNMISGSLYIDVEIDEENTME